MIFLNRDFVHTTEILLIGKKVLALRINCFQTNNDTRQVNSDRMKWYVSALLWFCDASVNTDQLTYVENVFLDDCVDDNTDEEIEEDAKQVLQPGHVISELVPSLCTTIYELLVSHHNSKKIFKNACFWIAHRPSLTSNYGQISAPFPMAKRDAFFKLYV